jgi:predicted nucleotidyltransferase
MELHENLGIKKDLLLQIQYIISKCSHVKKAVIFGSRARGDYKINSDIDIAIIGENVSYKDLNFIENGLSELNTALDFDIVPFEKISKTELRKNIYQDGVEIYVNE